MRVPTRIQTEGFSGGGMAKSQRRFFLEDREPLWDRKLAAFSLNS